MARLTRILAATEPEGPLAVRLLKALVVTLDLDGGAMTIGYAGPERTMVCATDEVAERIEELQDVLREGPGFDAFRTGHLVAEDLPEQEVRWPMLLQALSEHHGAVRIFAVPMKLESGVLGVIQLYRLTERQVEFDATGAQFLTNAIGVAILGRFERSESADLLWSTRDRINQASGMVVAQLRIPPADALALLRAHAYAQDSTLAEVADAVVNRELDFRDPEGERRSP